MGLKFNPFLLSGFDMSGGSSSLYWTDPVATEAALPVSGTDGEARVALDTDKIYVWDGTSSQWIDTGTTLAAFGSTPNANGLSLSTSDVGNIRYRTINLQPADATNPGGVSTAAQTFAGAKTFSSTIIGDIDKPAGTLALGGSASIVNIGVAGATVNINGSVNNNNVTNLNVTDALITINDGGGVGSASNTGLELEENAVITGYNKTSGDRASWTLKAPATAGVATITPGAGGITLDQSSHNPVTLAAAGSSPNANGASLSTQVLNLEPASGSFPGIISTTDQTMGNGYKVFTGTTPSSANITGTTIGILDINSRNMIWHNPASGVFTMGSWALDGPFNGASNNATEGQVLYGTSLVGGVISGTEGGYARVKHDRFGLYSIDPAAAGFTAGAYYFRVDPTELYLKNNAGTKTFQVLRASGNTVITGTLNVTGTITGNLSGTATNVTGVVAIANGGTNSSASLNNNRVIQSSGGAIVEAAAITASRALVSDSNGIPVHSTVTTTELGYVSGVTSAIQTQLNAKVSSVTGDIVPTSFSAANNQAAVADVTGLAFSNAVVRSFSAQVSVSLIATSSLYAVYELKGIQRGADWVMNATYTGDETGMVFSITTAGQVQYTSANSAGFTSNTVKFRALTTAV